jgi:glyoxylate/hydroxypyruvate reductase A
MSILVAADFNADEWAAWWPALQAALPGEMLLRDKRGVSLDDIDIALVANPPAGALQGLAGLGFVQSLWAGVDKLLADPTVPAQLPLARMVDPLMNEAMAQTALWAVLSLHRGFLDCAQRQRVRQWQQDPQQRADEFPVTVLGLGQMGRTAAQRLARNGYPVQAWSTREAAVEGVACSAGEAALRGALASAHVVVNLLPLTPATRGLFNAERIAQMAPGASLVNLARGGHVVEQDLLDALDRGHLRHAVLDVFATEPLPASHAFWGHRQVTVLPHIAAQTDARSAAQLVARNVRAFREGRPPENLVDRVRGY